MTIFPSLKFLASEILQTGVGSMKNVEEKSRSKNPVINKCMKHLEVIGADDKTRQIVYMYMKTLEDELTKMKAKELDHQSF